MLRECKKDFFQDSKKDKMTHFNISVAVERHRDNKSFFQISSSLY